MSIFTQENKQGNLLESLQQTIIYVMRASAAKWGYIYGAGVSVYNPYNEMLQVKQSYNQMDRKGYFHYTLNPEASDSIQADRFYALGIEVAELISHFCGNYQVLMAIHFNEETYHMHFVANNIDYSNGTRLDLDKKKLSDLKAEINVLLDTYDISVIRKWDNDCKRTNINFKNQTDDLIINERWRK